jgi:hypothetical protein
MRWMITMESRSPIPIAGWNNLDSAETRDWVRAEARLTDSYLEKFPSVNQLKENG